MGDEVGVSVGDEVGEAVRQTFAPSQIPQVLFVCFNWAGTAFVATHRVQYESRPSMSSYLQMDRLFALFSHTSLAGQAVGVTGLAASTTAMNTTNVTRRIEKNFMFDWMCVNDGWRVK
jgi:hypothetical protein